MSPSLLFPKTNTPHPWSSACQSAGCPLPFHRTSSSPFFVFVERVLTEWSSHPARDHSDFLMASPVPSSVTRFLYQFQDIVFFTPPSVDCRFWGSGPLSLHDLFPSINPPRSTEFFSCPSFPDRVLTKTRSNPSSSFSILWPTLLPTLFFHTSGWLAATCLTAFCYSPRLFSRKRWGSQIPPFSLQNSSLYSRGLSSF